MGFSFLAPLFLAGLAALTVPVLIHLTHRERKQALAFPSLMFVRKIPYKTHRRQKIRHWFLFLMRSLAVILVAGAFARPLLNDGGESARAFADARELVILLDRSHSMAYSDRWSRAVSAVRRVATDLGPDDRATLIAFDERAEALTQRTPDQAVLLAALAGAEVGSRTTRYGPALQLAREIIERSDRPRSEVILVTDFQRTGWDVRQSERLPEGTALTRVDLSDPNASNLAVTGATVSRDRSSGREEAIITAQLAGFGGSVAEDVPVLLEVDGQVVEERTVDVDPGDVLTVPFSPVVLPGRPVLGRVVAGDDALPGDNDFHFVITPVDPINVLIVEPRSAGADHSLYLVRALGIGSQPGFGVAIRRVTQLSMDDLSDRSVVMLNDAPFPAGGVGRRLREFVRDGGGLLVVLGRRSPPGAWPGEGTELLPTAFGGPVDNSASGGATLSYMDFDHPVFQLFQSPRSGDFSSARFFRYRRLEPADSVRVLARYSDGGTALVEGVYGDGKVVVMSSGVENFWNDLAVQPVFLPFVHELLRYLSGYTEPQPWFRVGNVIDLSDPQMLGEDIVAAAPELVVENPAGEPVIVRLSQETRFLPLGQAGIYRIGQVEDRADRSLTIAANLDPRESNLDVLDPDELAGAVTAQGADESATLEAVVLSPEDRERRQGLWWYLLLGAAGLLVLETLISNRMPRLATYEPRRG